jgi:hypothetical protein
MPSANDEHGSYSKFVRKSGCPRSHFRVQSKTDAKILSANDLSAKDYYRFELLETRRHETSSAARTAFCYDSIS